MTSSSRSAERLVQLTPALIVGVVALFALPTEAGGFRLAKWGTFGFALALGAAHLVCLPARHVPRKWWMLGAFGAAGILLPAFGSSRAHTHWPNALGLLAGLGFFFITVVAINNEQHARRANLVVLTTAGGLCSVVVLLQALGLRWLTSNTYTDMEFRAPGTFGNPNWAAAFLAPMVPLSLGLAVSMPRGWKHYGAAALLALASAATLSKGGLITLATGLFVFVLLSIASRRRQLMLMALAAACTIGLLTIGRCYDLTQASWLRGRIFLWRAALVLVSKHPITGVGLGGYPAAYGDAAATLIDGDPAAFFPLGSVDFAHHDLLQFAAEGGLVTAATFVLLAMVALARAQQSADPLWRGVGAAIAALLANGFADSTLRMPSAFALFFFLLGWLSPTTQGPKTSRSLLLAISLLGLIQGVRFTAGNAYWTLGREALRTGQPASAHLDKARFFLPEHGRSASQYARALARAGQIEEALAASSRASSLRFDFDDELFRRDLQTRSLDYASAVREWEAFGARYPGLVTPYLRLGALHLRASDRASAIAAYQAVLSNSQPTARADAARSQARAVLRSLLSRTPPL
jgi:O-antigen ligase